MKNFPVSAEDLPLAPGFPSTTISTSGYDPPTFYSSSGDTGPHTRYPSNQHLHYL